MVERQGIRRTVAHLILWISIAVVAFPVYLAIVAATNANHFNLDMGTSCFRRFREPALRRSRIRFIARSGDGGNAIW